MPNELVGIAVLALICILLTPYFKETLNIYVEQPNRVYLKEEYAKTPYPKKIVLHSRTFLPATYAGSEISAYETIKYLRNRGHSVSIIVNEYKYTEFDGFPIYDMDMNDKHNIVKDCDVIFFQSTDKNKMLEFSLTTFSLFIIYLIDKNKGRIIKKIKIIDKPDKVRKLHKKPTPLLGGMMIFSSFLLINLSLFFLHNRAFLLSTLIIPFPLSYLSDMIR